MYTDCGLHTVIAVALLCTECVYKKQTVHIKNWDSSRSRLNHDLAVLVFAFFVFLFCFPFLRIVCHLYLAHWSKLGALGFHYFTYNNFTFANSSIGISIFKTKLNDITYFSNALKTIWKFFAVWMCAMPAEVPMDDMVKSSFLVFFFFYNNNL